MPYEMLGELVGAMFGLLIPIIIIYKVVNIFVSKGKPPRQAVVTSMSITGVLMVCVILVISLLSGLPPYRLISLIPPYVISFIYLLNRSNKPGANGWFDV